MAAAVRVRVRVRFPTAAGGGDGDGGGGGGGDRIRAAAEWITGLQLRLGILLLPSSPLQVSNPARTHKRKRTRACAAATPRENSSSSLGWHESELIKVGAW